MTDREFFDERPVSVAIEPTPDLAVLSTTAGVVTMLDCRRGATIESGSVPIAVDGRPRLALSTTTPPWRDLEAGAEGPDVLALQEELQRLGFPVVADGELGAASIAAVELLRTGVSSGAREIRASDLLWFPARTATIRSCGATLGAPIEVGTTLFDLPGRAASATITDYPGDLLPGDRAIVVDGTRFDIAPGGLVDEAEAVAALEAAARARAAESGEGAGTVTVALILREPATVGAIPPGALYDVVADRGCVISEGRPVRVRPVASQLGHVFIAPIDGRLPRSVQIAPSGDRPC
ncbi:peptidoglycan-binding domain-containing protein [Agromyces mediolanus]|uniref:peptidoglycan-binding domain-containing protein n=1 Tax=Agromyces mediolanus TaxID=41986 RepID=UPI003834DE04